MKSISKTISSFPSFAFIHAPENIALACCANLRIIMTITDFVNPSNPRITAVEARVFLCFLITRGGTNNFDTKENATVRFVTVESGTHGISRTSDLHH